MLYSTYSMTTISEILSRGVTTLIPGEKALKEQLESGKELNVYFGIDPTSTKIHLGHTVPLRKLQQFAELGHNVTFLIGDFTALIGDTSDKEAERPALTTAQIEQNFETYKRQAEKVLDFGKIKVRYNSEWLKPLTFEDIVRLTQEFSLGDFISRELIKKRLESGKRIGLHEMLYPIMQGYDSYFMDTDLQIGGTDQIFNMQAGRTLQKTRRSKESFIMTTPILEGTDGRKMSKSWGNAVWLDDTAPDMYAKIMAVDDSLLSTYFTLVTTVPLLEINKITEALKTNDLHPMDAKKQLADVLVSELCGQEAAIHARNIFEKVVQKGELPENITVLPYPTTDLPLTIASLLTDGQLVESKSEARRLIEQGGIRLDGEKIIDPNTKITHDTEHIVQIGKTRTFRFNP